MDFIYVGRLDKEKGIEALLFCIKQLKKSKNIHFHIYGKGAYSEEILKLAQANTKTVSYYGRQDKKEISTQRSRCDFFIMPSNFLETFGLTACESLMLGVPVIGKKKGGLMPFIHEELNIENQDGANDNEKLHTLLQNIIQNNRGKTNYTKFIEKTKQAFSKENWEVSIKRILGGEKSLLVVSDFINYNGGGIETHIHDSREILTKFLKNYLLYGHIAPEGKRARTKKIIGMVFSFMNISDSIHITQTIKTTKIKTIWRHSISRKIGWLPLYTLSKSGRTNIITHHELGLFHPYPSKVYNISEIPKARSLQAFVKAGNTNSIIKKTSILGKYLLVWMIHKQLQSKQFIHIVPSERMIEVVKQRHPNGNIICIPHFVNIKQ